MYYEESMIDGALHWRGTPNGKWEPCRPARLNAVIAELREQAAQSLQAPEDYDVRIASFVEKTACILSGSPFPSGRSYYKARQISDLAIAEFSSPTAALQAGEK